MQGDVVTRFATARSWIDPGEEKLVSAAKAIKPRGRVLDLGVGAGRTIPLVAEFGPGYVGLDYSAAMVAVARGNHPGVEIVEGDARDLQAFGDESFDIVLFSNNGIDAVNHDGRLRILAEAYRVLAAGGLLLFSTYNLDGPSARERPWTIPGLSLSQPRRTLSRIKYRVLTAPAGLRNYRRLQGNYEQGEGWQVRINGSHEFGIVVHHITLNAEVAELEQVGFRRPSVWSSNDGAAVALGADTRDVWYFHILCEKPTPLD
jgi:SAM-dependent methyltransferase